MLDNLTEDQRILVRENLPKGRGSSTQIRKITWDDGKTEYGICSSGSWGHDQDWSYLSREKMIEHLKDGNIHDLQIESFDWDLGY